MSLGVVHSDESAGKRRLIHRPDHLCRYRRDRARVIVCRGGQSSRSSLVEDGRAPHDGQVADHGLLLDA